MSERSDGPPQAGAAPYLRIRNLTKRFGGFVALDDVSLDITPGEFTCFLGPSGCGKTTLLRAISGLDVQTSGEVWQAGEDISQRPVAERDFGIVFQSYALFPNLTVRQNVGYGLVSRRMRRVAIRVRVDELLALVDLEEHADKYPAQLSGGQQQRVALARALAPSPGLLLLDEPLSALDARVRVRLRDEIKAIQRRLGVTTIMVTHDQDEALALADRIVLMNKARIEQIGTPVEIYRKPQSRFVADFIGRMNFLTGRKLSHDEIELCGFRLCCANGAAALAEGAVTVCIRPEDIVVRNVDGAGPNVIPAAIERMDFSGSHFNTALSIAGAEHGLVAEFSINAVRDLDLSPGRTIKVALPPERLRVFAPTDA